MAASREAGKRDVRAATNAIAADDYTDIDGELMGASGTELTLEEGALAPGATYRTEINLLRYPWYVISRKNPTGTIAFNEKIRRPDGTVVEASWEVTSDAKLGLPNAWDADVRRLIDEIMSAQPRPIENPICLGSIAEILDALGRKNTGPNNVAIKKSLRRLVSTTIHSSGSYYDKSRKRWLEESFHILERVTFKGERLPNGAQADAVYVTVSRPYLDNFNANYTIPLDWAYQKRVLRLPTTKRMYELLNQIFYRECRRRERAGERVAAAEVAVECRYSRLAALAPLTPFHQLWAVRNQLDPSHGELIESEYILSPVTIEEVGSGRSHDFLITYMAGPRAIAEYVSAATGAAAPAPRELPPPRTPAATRATHATRSKRAAKGREQASVKTGQWTKAVESSAATGEVVERLVEFGLGRDVAESLEREYGDERVARQLDAMPFRKRVVNPQGYLVRAIRADWGVPPEAAAAATEEAPSQAGLFGAGDEARSVAPSAAVDAWTRLKGDVAATLSETLGAAVAERILADWFAPIVPADVADGALVLRVPNGTYTRFLTSRSNVSTALRERAAAHGLTLTFAEGSGGR
jgi:hypothetical protein